LLTIGNTIMGTYLLGCPKSGLPLNPGIEMDAETLTLVRDSHDRG